MTIVDKGGRGGKVSIERELMILVGMRLGWDRLLSVLEMK